MTHSHTHTQAERKEERGGLKAWVSLSLHFQKCGIEVGMFTAAQGSLILHASAFSLISTNITERSSFTLHYYWPYCGLLSENYTFSMLCWDYMHRRHRSLHTWVWFFLILIAWFDIGYCFIQCNKSYIKAWLNRAIPWVILCYILWVTLFFIVLYIQTKQTLVVESNTAILWVEDPGASPGKSDFVCLITILSHYLISNVSSSLTCSIPDLVLYPILPIYFNLQGAHLQSKPPLRYGLQPLQSHCCSILFAGIFNIQLLLCQLRHEKQGILSHQRFNSISSKHWH